MCRMEHLNAHFTLSLHYVLHKNTAYIVGEGCVTTVSPEGAGGCERGGSRLPIESANLSIADTSSS